MKTAFPWPHKKSTTLIWVEAVHQNRFSLITFEIKNIDLSWGSPWKQRAGNHRGNSPGLWPRACQDLFHQPSSHPQIDKSILLFFNYLIYQVYPARARAPPGGLRRQCRRLDRVPMVASLCLGAFWRFWVATWRSSTRLCCMIRNLVSIFFILCPFLILFSYFSTSKIIDFHGTIVIFEVFAVSTCDVTFVVF